MVPNHSQNLWGKVLVQLRIIIPACPPPPPLIISMRKGYHDQSIYAFLICGREYTYFKYKFCVTCFPGQKKETKREEYTGIPLASLEESSVHLTLCT